MNPNQLTKHTGAWRFQTWASFLLALGMMLSGIFIMEGDYWIKGYLTMGTIFTIGTCFSLAKTIRDDHEAQSLINRINQAKTEEILTKYEK